MGTDDSGTCQRGSCPCSDNSGSSWNQFWSTYQWGSWTGRDDPECSSIHGNDAYGQFRHRGSDERNTCSKRLYRQGLYCEIWGLLSWPFGWPAGESRVRASDRECTGQRRRAEGFYRYNTYCQIQWFGKCTAVIWPVWWKDCSIDRWACSCQYGSCTAGRRISAGTAWYYQTVWNRFDFWWSDYRISSGVGGCTGLLRCYTGYDHLR